MVLISFWRGSKIWAGKILQLLLVQANENILSVLQQGSDPKMTSAVPESGDSKGVRDHDPSS